MFNSCIKHEQLLALYLLLKWFHPTWKIKCWEKSNNYKVLESYQATRTEGLLIKTQISWLVVKEEETSAGYSMNWSIAYNICYFHVSKLWTEKCFKLLYFFSFLPPSLLPSLPSSLPPSLPSFLLSLCYSIFLKINQLSALLQKAFILSSSLFTHEVGAASGAWFIWPRSSYYPWAIYSLILEEDHRADDSLCQSRLV